MTTIVRAPRPLLFWASGGDVIMFGAPCIRLDADAQTDLLSLFDDEKDAALVNKNTDAWLTALDKAHQLTEARIAAGKWARASGDLGDVGRRAA